MGELGGQTGADVHKVLLARLSHSPRLPSWADDVDDIDIGDVVELIRPGLAHGDHGKDHLVRLRSDGGTRDEQGGVQSGAGELRHTAADGGDVLDRARVGHIIGDDGCETVPVDASQRRGRPIHR